MNMARGVCISATTKIRHFKVTIKKWKVRTLINIEKCYLQYRILIETEKRSNYEYDFGR